MKISSQKKGFTLVELIIVIAIIAILAVTAFLLLTKRLAKARDASRSSNLANIENSLQISLTENSSLPKPDSYTLIYASGTSNVIGYQGYFGEGVKDSLGNINSAPKDGDDYFTYYLNSDLNKYQIAGFMENEFSYNPNVVSAVDYSSRYVNVRGDKLGLLTDVNKSPLQSLGLTGLDILNTDIVYTTYLYNNLNIAGTGKSLVSILTMNNKNIAKYDTGLVGFWDMEGTINSGSLILLKDLSSYGNNGICYNSGTVGNCGNIGPQFVQGKIGKAMKFDGISGIIDLGNNSSITTLFNSGGTISAWFLANTSGGGNLGRIINKEVSGSLSGRRYLLMNPSHGISLGQNFSVTEGGWGLVNNNIFKSWHNVVVTYNNQSLSNKATFYIDGLLVDSQETSTPSGTLNSAINTNLYIGNTYNGGRTFDGMIDDIRIYNRALSDDEVKALYNATN